MTSEPAAGPTHDDTYHGRRPGREPGLRVVIAEDLALLREGLVRLLSDNSIDVVAAVDNGTDLVAAVELHQPDVAIVDIRLPPSFRDEGLRAAIEARTRAPGTAILVVSQYIEQTYTAELLAGGYRQPGKGAKGKAPVPGGPKEGASSGNRLAGAAASDLAELIQELSDQMHAAAGELQFELAARLRDEISGLKKELRQMHAATA